VKTTFWQNEAKTTNLFKGPRANIHAAHALLPKWLGEDESVRTFHRRSRSPRARAA
jgi:hypothetical protein